MLKTEPNSRLAYLQSWYSNLNHHTILPHSPLLGLTALYNKYYGFKCTTEKPLQLIEFFQGPCRQGSKTSGTPEGKNLWLNLAKRGKAWRRLQGCKSENVDPITCLSIAVNPPAGLVDCNSDRRQLFKIASG